jgi:hypothetical protein
VNALADVIQYREALTRAVLDMLAAERRLSEDNASVLALRDAETAISLAARDLTNAVDDLPEKHHPRGWEVRR